MNGPGSPWGTGAVTWEKGGISDEEGILVMGACKQRKVVPGLSLQTPREVFLCSNNSFFFLVSIPWQRAVFPRVLHAAAPVFGNKHSPGCSLLLAKACLSLECALPALAAAGIFFYFFIFFFVASPRCGMWHLCSN